MWGKKKKKISFDEQLFNQPPDLDFAKKTIEKIRKTLDGMYEKAEHEPEKVYTSLAQEILDLCEISGQGMPEILTALMILTNESALEMSVPKDVLLRATEAAFKGR